VKRSPPPAGTDVVSAKAPYVAPAPLTATFQG